MAELSGECSLEVEYLDGVFFGLRVAGVGEVNPSARPVEGDAGGALDTGVGDEPDSLALPVEDADATFPLFDDVEVLLGVEGEAHGPRQPFDPGERLGREVEDEYRRVGEIRDVQPLSVIGHRQAHGFDDAVRRGFLAAEEVEQTLEKRGLPTQVRLAGNAAHEFDARREWRWRPNETPLLGRRRRGGAAAQDREQSPDGQPNGFAPEPALCPHADPP